MEIYIIFPFLDPRTFFLLLITNIQVITSDVFIFFAVWRYRKDLKYSRLLLVSSAIALGFFIAFFFIPTIGATNVSEEEDIMLANIFTLYFSLMFIPTAVLPSISLLIFGWANRRNVNFYLFISGINIVVYYLWRYIDYIEWNYNRFNYPLPPLTPLEFFYLRILPYIFLAILIQAFILFIIHGISNKQSRFRNTGIIIVNVIILMLILNPYLIRLIYETFS